MQSLETIFLSIAIFGSGVLVIFIIAKYSYLTKKVFAEKGMTGSVNRMSYAEIACIVIGIALGLGASSVFTTIDLPEDAMDMLVYATILAGAGLGLLGAHFIRKKGERA
ncbi:hypothetical protein SAMN05216327_107351 [Dyadobacter sp. SG02]|uniref:hypothetical protein n=1 Tax=Dyadobacter sp. SG02 TaxID=1855291 RepID=UPI0008ABA9C9|nr:hypothetical protein [Dyadobacter sp. SG02]SEJ25128.1 hypothetical protein SAMN05216327_107351 [Dyadobacter sp. SG02]